MLSKEAINAINLATTVATTPQGRVVKVPYMVTLFSQEGGWLPVRATPTRAEAQKAVAFIQNRFQVADYDIKIRHAYETLESNLRTM